MAAGFAALSVMTLLTGCSESEKKTAVSTPSSSTSTSVAAVAPSSNVAVEPSSMVTGSTRPVPKVSTDSVSATAPTSVQFVIGSRPFGPTSVSAANLSAAISSGIPVTGVSAEIQPGMVLKVPKVDRAAGVIWTSKTAVIKVDSLGVCSSGCPTLRAPSGALRVMLVPQSQAAGIAADAPVSAG